MKYLTTILICLVIGMAVALLISIKGCSNAKQSFSDLKAYESSLNDTIVKTKARNGLLIANIKQVNLDASSFQEAVNENASMKAELENMRIKLKNVQSITQASTQTSVSGSKAIPLVAVKDSSGHIDSVKAIPCVFAPFLFADGDKFDSLYQKVSRDSIKWRILHFDYLTFVQHTVRPIFKRNYVETSVVAEDPNTRITGLKSFHYVEQKKWFQTNAVKIGVGILAGIFLEKKLGL